MDVGLPTPRNSHRASFAKPSMFKSSMETLEKLFLVPELEAWLFPEGVENARRATRDLIVPLDPVAILWSFFRIGAPLCLLFNMLQLNVEHPLNVPTIKASEARDSSGKPSHVSKACVYHFLKACKQDLNMPDSDLFTITELYREDTAGFVKVLQVVQHILLMLESRSLLPQQVPQRKLSIGSMASPIDAPSDNYSKVLAEILATEQSYVNDLEQLFAYRSHLMREGKINHDVIFRIFVNLTELLDFQRRFHLGMEAMLCAGNGEPHRLGQLFINSAGGFELYSIFCANYKKAMAVVSENAVDLIAPDYIKDPLRELSSLLIKPTQRICKYPLLLKELQRYTNAEEYPYVRELAEAKAVVERAVETVNEATRKEENRAIVEDLLKRVENWKGLNYERFGELIVHDTFLMCSSENVERQYLVYLFERVLLCCKEAKRLKQRSRDTISGTTAPPVPLIIKGNIFMSAMTSVLPCSKLTMPVTAVGLKVFWRDGQDLESFTLKCRNDEQVRLWSDKIELLINKERTRRKVAMSVHIKNLLRSSQLTSAYGLVVPPHNACVEDSGVTPTPGPHQAQSPIADGRFSSYYHPHNYHAHPSLPGVVQPRS